MKLRILTLFVLGALFGCQKNSNQTNPPPLFVDPPFKVGERDSGDFYSQYNPPLNLYDDQLYRFDLELDGNTDFYLERESYYGNMAGNYSLRFFTDTTQSYIWEIAALPFRDSIFYCNTPGVGDPHLNNYYYNKATNQCSGAQDDFIAYRYLGDHPEMLNKGDDFLNANHWQSDALLHYYDFDQFTQFHSEYYTPLYAEDVGLHYLSLRSIRPNDTVFAWIKIDVNGDGRPWNPEIKIYEQASKKPGTN